MIISVQGTKDLEILGGRRGSTPLHVASAIGSIDVIQTLLAAGANVKEVNEMGECGLQWATRQGRTAVVKLLLAAGADPNFRDRSGRTPLYYAFVNGQKACAIALLEAGADSTDADGKGMSVADLAKREGKHGSWWTCSDFSSRKS